MRENNDTRKGSKAEKLKFPWEENEQTPITGEVFMSGNGEKLIGCLDTDVQSLEACAEYF
jgi:hypothetical protein